MKNTKSGNLHYLFKNTIFGDVTLVWQDIPEVKVTRILLTYRKILESQYPRAILSTNDEIEKLAENIADFLKGEPKQFDLDVIDLAQCSEFQKRVLIAECPVF